MQEGFQEGRSTQKQANLLHPRLKRDWWESGS